MCVCDRPYDPRTCYCAEFRVLSHFLLILFFEHATLRNRSLNVAGASRSSPLAAGGASPASAPSRNRSNKLQVHLLIIAAHHDHHKHHRHHNRQHRHHHRCPHHHRRHQHHHQHDYQWPKQQQEDPGPAAVTPSLCAASIMAW